MLQGTEAVMDLGHWLVDDSIKAHAQSQYLAPRHSSDITILLQSPAHGMLEHSR